MEKRKRQERKETRKKLKTAQTNKLADWCSDGKGKLICDLEVFAVST